MIDRFGMVLGIAVGMLALSHTAQAQETPWYALGEQLAIEIPDDAIFLSGEDQYGIYIESYVLEEDADGRAVTGIRLLRSEDTHPFSTVSALEAATITLASVADRCPEVETEHRAPQTIDGRPGMRFDVVCPADPSADRGAEYTTLTAVSGLERMHVIVFQALDATSDEARAAHELRVSGARFCVYEEADGPCVLFR